VAERCLQAASMDWEFIDHILLTGGSSLLPLVRDKIAQRTGRSREDLMLKQPHQAVAYGAALIADQLYADGKSSKTLQRATAWQLGIRVADKQGQPCVQVMIDKNQPVPVNKTVTFPTNRDNQPRMVIEVVQQKDTNQEEKSLGYFIFSLPDGTPKNYKLDIDLAYDMEGLVTATATDTKTGQKLKQIIDETGAALDDELIKQKEWVSNTRINE
jgi:molecular chaperone DnaK